MLTRMLEVILALAESPLFRFLALIGGLVLVALTVHSLRPERPRS